MQAIQFADGTSWDRSQIASQAAYRPSEAAGVSASLSGSDKADTFAVGAGEEAISGGYGDDTYVYSAATSGDLLIKEHWYSWEDAQQNTLKLSDLNASDVVVSRISGSNDLTLTAKSTGKTITVEGHFGGHDGVQAIQFADGTSWDRSQIAAEAIVQGTAGDDQLTLPADGVTAAGGRGDDTLSVQGSGADTIRFAKGDGHDTIDNPGSGYTRNDTLALTDALPSNVQVTRDGDALVVSIPETGDSVRVKWQFWQNSTQYGINRITFADGTSWTRDQIVAQAVVRGTSGNDAVTAPSDGATIQLGQGDDTLSVSGNGADTIRFAKGDGHDTIDNPGSGYTRNDTLRLTDILPSEVTLTRSGDMLTVTVPGTGESITMPYQFWGNGHEQGVSHITFADGSTWDRDQIEAKAWIRAADTIDSTLTGDGQAHVYVFASTSGNAVINDGGHASRLVLSGLNPADVILARGANPNDLVITDKATGKNLTVSGQFSRWWEGGEMQSITFGDGTALSPSDIRQKLLDQAQASSSGTIYGYADHDDILVAGSGDKLLNGLGGADTYVYGKSGGHDTIQDGGNASKLVLAGINASEVKLTRTSGSNDLTVSVQGGADIVIKNQLHTDASGGGTLQSFTFADGTAWSSSDIASHTHTVG